MNRYFIKLFFAIFLASVSANAQVSKFLPHHAKAQFAGGIGFMSIGAGYSNARQTIEGDIYYGYVPESIGGLDIHSATAKFTTLPIRPWYHKKLQVKPLAAGVLINYTFGRQYFAFDPPNYPYDYYRHPTAIFTALFIGGQVNWQVRKDVRSVGLYYELLGFDRDILSLISNTKSLNLSDILHLGLGVRVTRK